jgi:AcrR family transcriptional regulator
MSASHEHAPSVESGRAEVGGAGSDGGRRIGRRPGDANTREDILEAARAAFAELGYEKATLRVIAEEAAVDPALVCHYFGTKDGLFAAALELPMQPSEVFRRAIAAGDERKIGQVIVRTFLEAWEPPETRVRLMAMLRSAMTNDAAMGMVRELLTREVFGPITEILGVPDAELRATLVGSQLVGLAVMRYVARLQPLASASIDELVVALGPTVQRYLAGDIAAVPPSAAVPSGTSTS